ncbi:glycine zipper domain-containing protein [Luteolibacter arcticus]|uniref:Glycine zipper domain-containing protein n=1 Tax=Luteolibacter arcticus TaxID=1581411 RepID=A0ABT3GFX0_9BACT|nr:glycine zipper domain-containing protein [Luteolibacter arcticus]MCW1922514.1 glycine zipper domain-containing protein [Luteolibacter arcticus]
MNPPSTRWQSSLLPFAAVTVFAIFTNSCAQTADGRLAQGQGTAIGAVAGGLLGYAIGGQRGAVAGAALGGAGGFAYGSHIANKKAKYASTEKWLDDCIKDAESKRSDATAYNKKLDGRLAALQRDIRAARAANDTAKLKTLKGQIRTEKKEAIQQRDSYKKEAELQRGAIREAGSEAPGKVKLLQNSTKGIESQAVGIDNKVERYAALESQIDV